MRASSLHWSFLNSLTYLVTFKECYFSCWHCSDIQGREYPRPHGIYLNSHGERKTARPQASYSAASANSCGPSTVSSWFLFFDFRGCAPQVQVHIYCSTTSRKTKCAEYYAHRAWGFYPESERWEGTSVPEIAPKHLKLIFKTLVTSWRHWHSHGSTSNFLMKLFKINYFFLCSLKELHSTSGLAFILNCWSNSWYLWWAAIL